MIDADVLSAARDLAARQGSTIGQVISDLARRALTGSDEAAAPEKSFHGFVPLPPRGGVVSNDLVSAIRDEEGA